MVDLESFMRPSTVLLFIVLYAEPRLTRGTEPGKLHRGLEEFLNRLSKALFGGQELEMSDARLEHSQLVWANPRNRSIENGCT
jgi:hypothetical protein